MKVLEIRKSVLLLMALVFVACASKPRSAHNQSGNQDIIEEQNRDVMERFRYIDFRGPRF